MRGVNRCHGCGGELPPEAGFCAHCGYPTATAGEVQTEVPQLQAAVPQAHTATAQTQAMQAPAAAALVGAGTAKTVAMSADALLQPTVEAMPQLGPAAAAAGTAAAQGNKAKAMTMMAGMGLDMAKIFNTAFGAPFPGWRAELSEPVGPSTGGGKQALQPITLVAPSGERLAVGRVDPVQRFAHLRDHQLVDTMHQERFGRPLALSPQEFNQWMEAVRGYLKTSGLQVSYDKPGATLERASSSGGSAIMLWIALAVTAAALIAVIVWYLTR